MAKTKKKLICSLITLIIAIIVVISETLAWFYISATTSQTGIHLRVEEYTNQLGSLDVEVVMGGTQIGELEIFPDNYATVKFHYSNTTENDVEFGLKIQNLKIKYEFSSGFLFDDKNIYTNDYYLRNTNTKFDETTVANTDKQSFMKSFVSPMINALKYEVYFEQMQSFHTGYVDKYISTNLPNATTDLLNSNQFNLIDSNIELSISDYSSLGNTYNILDNKVTVPSKTSIDLFMVIYYDPNYISYGEYNNTLLELRNSNCFLGQDIDVTFATIID